MPFVAPPIADTDHPYLDLQLPETGSPLPTPWTTSPQTWTGLQTFNGGIRTNDGTAPLPSHSFTSAPTYGMFYAGGYVQLSAGGVSRFGVNSSTITTSVPLLVPDGTLLLPAFAFNSEPTLGLYRSATGTMNVTGTLVSSNGLAASTGGFISWSSRALLASPSAGAVNVANSNNSIGSQFKVDALPTVASGFGTGAAVVAGSTPFAGAVSVGTTSGNNGTINFNGTTFPSAPFVTLSQKNGLLALRASVSPTQLTIVASGSFADNEVISWHAISAK